MSSDISMIIKDFRLKKKKKKSNSENYFQGNYPKDVPFL